MTPAYTHCGKQILEHGAHYADARTPVAAAQIVAALNARCAGCGARTCACPDAVFQGVVPHHRKDCSQ